MVATFGTSWTWSALTPLAIAGLVGILASQITGILALVPPSVAQGVDIALLSGVHTKEEVQKIQTATAPGIVPSIAVAAAILGKQVAPDGVTVFPTPPSPEVMAKIEDAIRAGSPPPRIITTADGSYKTEPNSSTATPGGTP